MCSCFFLCRFPPLVKHTPHTMTHKHVPLQRSTFKNKRKLKKKNVVQHPIHTMEKKLIVIIIKTCTTDDT